jgi:hypothetical protein
MALIDRVKNIIVTPRTEWPVIAAEPATVGSLYTGYIMILAAIGPIALAIRLAAVGLGLGIASVIVQYLLALAMTYVVALIVDALAPTFGGERNFVQSLKLTAYAMTPGWVAGVFNLLGTAGGFLALIAMVYGFYLFYLGAPIVKKVTADRAVGYTVIVIVCILVLWFVISGMIMGLFFGGAMMTGMGMMR